MGNLGKYDRLSSLDVSMLYAESPTWHMHVGGMMVFEESDISIDEIREIINSRLQRVPRFRKKLMWVPYEAGRPIWIDDPDFDIRYHVRHAGLASPGGLNELREMFARLMSTALDRTRPLWEIWIIDMEGGRRGMIKKTHHCLIDGISGVDVLSVLLDLSPEKPSVEGDDWTPEKAPSKKKLMFDSIRERLTIPSEVMRSIQKAARKPFDAMEDIRDTGEGFLQLGSDALAEKAPKTSLVKRVGAHRRFETATVTLEDIKTIKNTSGTTVNDVVLALVAGALRRFFLARGELILDEELHVSVPVSVRSQDHRHTLGNEVSALLGRLPIGMEDPKARLARISQWMRKQKESHQLLAAQNIMRLADFAPPTLLALASRVAVSQFG